MARWMDISKWYVYMLIAIILLIALTFPICAYGQPAEDTSEGSGKGVTQPADFGTLADEGVIGGDVPTRDDFLAGEDEGLPTVGIWNIVISLCLVLVIFWAVFRFVVRPLMQGAVLGRGVEDLRIIASLPIAPTKSVQVIKLVDRLLVVGIAEGGMHLLTEITDPGEVSEMLKAIDEKNPAKYHPFKKAFETMLSRKGESNFEEKQKTFNTTLGKLKEKIEALKGSPSKED